MAVTWGVNWASGGTVRWIPVVAVLAVLLLVAPVWPWSRGWGWTPAAMVGVTLGTILLFTLSVLPG